MSVWRTLAVAAPAVILGQNAYAAGFALFEQSATSLGLASAGSAVEKDASVQMTNPAGLGLVDGTQGVLGNNVYFTHLPFTNQGSTNLLGLPASGGNPTSSKTIDAPYGYFAHSFGDFRVGFATGTNFGLETKYPHDSVVRYLAEKTKLNTIDLNPNVAYKVGPTLTFGAGLVARYSTAEFTNAIDYGSIGAASHVPGSIPQGQDGDVRLKGSDWSYGFKLGMTYQPLPSTVIGLGFRSEVSSKLTGDAQFDLNREGAILSSLSGAFKNTGISAAVDYPEELSLGVSHDLTSRLTLYGDFTWVNWSRFKELRIQFANLLQPDAVTPENWGDEYKLSVGAAYKITSAWTGRTGLAYDKSPVPDASHRTIRVPDADRVWATIGAGYDFGNFGINVAYAHLFFDKSTVSQANATAGVANGIFDNAEANILTADLTYRF